MPASFSSPADLRAIAARVMAGKDVNNEVAVAVGYTQKVHQGSFQWMAPNRRALGNAKPPDFLHSLDAADLLMAPLRERGWRFSTMEVDREKVQVHGTRVLTARDIVKMRSGVGSYLSDTANAPTEPRARTALALLCRAVEMGG